MLWLSTYCTRPPMCCTAAAVLPYTDAIDDAIDEAVMQFEKMQPGLMVFT